MKSFIKMLWLLLLPAFAMAQYNTSYWEEISKKQADSLRWEFQHSLNDTLHMAIARSLAYYYMEINRDSALYFTQQQSNIANRLKLKLWEADALDNMGYLFSELRKYPQSLQSFLAALKIAEDKETENNIWHPSKFSIKEDPTVGRLTVLSFCHEDMGGLYSNTGNIQKQLSNYLEALKIGESIHDMSILSTANMNIGWLYLTLNKLDSALIFEQRALDYSNISGFGKYKGHILIRMGNIYFKKGNYALSKQYYKDAMQQDNKENNLRDLADVHVRLSYVLSATGHSDSSLWYAKKGLELSESTGSPDVVEAAYISLSAIYRQRKEMDSAYLYQGLAMTAKDSLNNLEKMNQFQNIGFDEQLRVQELENEKIENQNKVRTYSMLAGLGMLSIIAFIIYRNNRQKQRANVVLVKTLADLKSTQSQLIQSEKMASLGELTAGIAHEIQNPLNFVNNFSEVNKELIEEIKNENNIDEIKAIAEDIKQNSEKILFHGQRADAIVKGMLQHSRQTKGIKEPTDINALADEYLRLNYYGLKAKDRDFNAEIKTDLDESIGKINIIPQDIERVLLNLYSNAFYAVMQKQKDLTGASHLSGQQPYVPTVTIVTKKLDNKIELRVKDNGPGISQNIVDKIFQPFFTTKPTGQGTGLGLSLAYDIIKAHGGEIKVETLSAEAAAQAGKEGGGSKFIIQLPV